MILRNSAICNNCNQEIISKYQHDYITCSCGQLSIDGGSSYLKRNSNHYVDTSLSSIGVQRNNFLNPKNICEIRLPHTIEHAEWILGNPLHEQTPKTWEKIANLI